MTMTKQMLCAALVSFSLAACSSSNDSDNTGELSGAIEPSSGGEASNTVGTSDNPDTGSATAVYGSVSVSIDTRQQFDQDFTETDIDASFNEITFESAITESQFISNLEAANNQINAVLYGDTLGCTDRDDIEPLSIPENSEEPVSELSAIRSLSAGEVISVTSPSGSWPELTQFNEDGDLSYYQLAPVEGHPAQGTTLDIPGDEFPPLANLELPFITPLINIRAEFVDAGAGPQFTIYWEAGVDASNEISVRFSRFDETESRFIGADCLVPDTGSFAVPMEFSYLFPDGELDTYTVFIDRFRTSYIQRDDVLMVLSVHAAGEWQTEFNLPTLTLF